VNVVDMDDSLVAAQARGAAQAEAAAEHDARVIRPPVGQDRRTDPMSQRADEKFDRASARGSGV
jgi:hypothetical protein